MKSHRQVLTLHVPERCGFVNLTDQVETAVAASGVQEGLCLVNSMHITSSVFINDEVGPASASCGEQEDATGCRVR